MVDRAYGDPWRGFAKGYDGEAFDRIRAENRREGPVN